MPVQSIAAMEPGIGDGHSPEVVEVVEILLGLVSLDVRERVAHDGQQHVHQQHEPHQDERKEQQPRHDGVLVNQIRIRKVTEEDAEGRRNAGLKSSGFGS